MNKIFKTISLFCVVAFFAASCSKWTSVESIGVTNPSLAETNPALYNAYLESLRAYRVSEHQMTIARFDNKAQAPVSMADHLNSIPDSVDLVVLNNIDAINDKLQSEKEEIYGNKAQKTYAAVDFSNFVNAYKEYLEGIEIPEEESEVVVVPFVDFVKIQSEIFTEKVALNKLHGVYVVYPQVNPNSLNEEEKEDLVKLQEAYFGTICNFVKNNGLGLILEANPRYIIATDVVLNAEAIVLSTEAVVATGGFDAAVIDCLGEGVPTDKFIAAVTAINVNDPDNSNGYFGTESSAIVGAAKWAVNANPNYTKLGICVNHAQYDYYHIGANYGQIKTAISIMNPSPVK